MAAHVSEPIIKRLPAYYRHLRELEDEGVEQISSRELGERMAFTASQVRQDINCFGGAGRQGYGYNVAALREHVGHIMGIDREHSMILIGMGNIGHAVVRSANFPAMGFRFTAAFDCDRACIGREVAGLTVRNMNTVEAYLSEHAVDIAVIAVPVESAQSVAERLYGLGIRGFWNFAPLDLKLPEDASVVDVHLDSTLQVLSYRLLQNENKGDAHV